MIVEKKWQWGNTNNKMEEIEIWENLPKENKDGCVEGGSLLKDRESSLKHSFSLCSSQPPPRKQWLSPKNFLSDS